MSDTRAAVHPYLTGLLHAARAIEGQDLEKAYERLFALLEHDRETHPEQVNAGLFATALARSVGAEGERRANLYLSKLPVAQIDVFNEMAQKLPLITIAGRIANRILLEAIGHCEVWSLIDFGIGSGRQELALLDELAAAHTVPDEVTIVGVEPSGESLDGARRALLRRAGALGIALTFVPIPKRIEELAPGDWQRLGELPGALVVNEAFALHHVPTTRAGGDLKDATLQRIRALRPEAFVLTEPHSDHQTASLPDRVQNAWQHYGSTLRLVDRLELSIEVKSAIKLQFFAREIDDVLSHEDGARTERHETAEMWIERVRRAGFELRTGLGWIAGLAPELITLSHRDGYVGLDVDGETAVAVMCAA